MKTYRIETTKGELVSGGYGTLKGCKEDLRDIQTYFKDRLLIWDEQNELHD